MKKVVKDINLKVKKNESMIFPFIWINGREQEVTVHAELIGEGANLTIVGIFIGKKSGSVVFNTDVIHTAPKTKSLTHIRGVFMDHASFNNDGMVRIQKGAVGADGYFASKILLFDNAKGRSVPSLEIDENDLKAGHASTVGRPDENQIFYLQSRGLSEKEAEKLIVSGFFETTLTMLPKENRSTIRKKIRVVL